MNLNSLRIELIHHSFIPFIHFWKRNEWWQFSTVSSYHDFWHFPPIFVLLKLTCLVTLFDRKLQVFKKLAKMDHFWHFFLTFVHSKCKRSSLRSQCWMRLFLWFSNTVFWLKIRWNLKKIGPSFFWLHQRDIKHLDNGKWPSEVRW